MILGDFPEVTYAVSDKTDGNLSLDWGEAGSVVENRNVFLAKHGLKLNDCIVMELEHKDNVVIVDDHYKSKDVTDVVQTDALITKTKGICLFLLTADCLPVCLYDPVKQAIALVHLGWKSTDLKLIQKVIKVMRSEFGTELRDIRAYIGPCIHKESYKHEHVEQKERSDWQPYLEVYSSGEMSIDLVAFNIDQMQESGISAKHITTSPVDTAAANQYFSHYRAVRTEEPEGRFATILALK
jgi:polyphenol oxidase